tara:strand:- start:12088 stop:13266 length:1179 start_codon:yes stop_codon:yes gene_type:complete
MRQIEFVKIGDVCDFIGGSQPPKSTFIYDLAGLNKDDYVRLIQIRDYKSDKHIVYIPKDKTKKFCSESDVMIGRYGPPVFQILKGLKGAYNVALMKAIPDESILDKEYLFKFLQSPNIQKYVIALSERAAGQSGVNKPALHDYPIYLPTLETQKLIVAKLDKAFADIEKAKVNAEQNLNNSKELFDSYLLNKFDNKKGNWSKFKLTEISQVIDSLHKTPKYVVDGFPMVRVTDIKFGGLVLSKTKKVDKQTFIEFSKRYTPKVGDIVFSRVGSYGRSSIVCTNEEFCLGQNTVFLIPSINSYFFYYFLNSPIAKNQIDKLVSGSTQPTVSLKSIKSIEILVPEVDEQEKIVDEIKKMEVHTQNLERIYLEKLNVLEELKQSILQKAFNGELA